MQGRRCRCGAGQCRPVCKDGIKLCEAAVQPAMPTALVQQQVRMAGWPPPPLLPYSRPSGLHAEVPAVHLGRLLGHLAQHSVQLRPREHGADEHAVGKGKAREQRPGVSRQECTAAHRRHHVRHARHCMLLRWSAHRPAAPTMLAPQLTSASSTPRAPHAAAARPPPWSPTQSAGRRQPERVSASSAWQASGSVGCQAHSWCFWRLANFGYCSWHMCVLRPGVHGTRPRPACSNQRCVLAPPRTLAMATAKSRLSSSTSAASAPLLWTAAGCCTSCALPPCCSSDSAAATAARRCRREHCGRCSRAALARGCEHHGAG